MLIELNDWDCSPSTSRTAGRGTIAPYVLPRPVRRGPRGTIGKADILVSNGASLPGLGLTSRREADRLTRDLELLRNHLAHAQELEESHLATPTRLASFLDSILRAEFVQRIVDSHRTSSGARGGSSNR
jgi:hypothetical protein